MLHRVARETELVLAILGKKPGPLTGRVRELALEYNGVRNIPRSVIPQRFLTLAQIRAATELGELYATRETLTPKIFNSPGLFYDEFGPRLSKLDKEEFHAILLNQKYGLIKDVCVSVGSLTQSIVHPREVFKPAILHSAAGIVLMHNHPSGDPSPSSEDIRLTSRLREVGDLHGIKVVDHVIIGSGRFISLRDMENW